MIDWKVSMPTLNIFTSHTSGFQHHNSWHRLLERFNDWLRDWIEWMIDKLVVAWMIGVFNEWMIDWIIKWLIGSHDIAKHLPLVTNQDFGTITHSPVDRVWWGKAYNGMPHPFQSLLCLQYSPSNRRDGFDSPFHSHVEANFHGRISVKQLIKIGRNFGNKIRLRGVKYMSEECWLSEYVP